MFKNPIFFFALAFICVVGLPISATAAPQILGLVATASPLPLTCTNGVCSVEVSGVCLQEHRPAPVTGTTYQAAGGSQLTLHVQDRSGATRSMPVTNQVEIKSKRLFNSVVVSLPEAMLKQGAGAGFQVSLSVGPMVTLLPVKISGDPNPHSEKEIADLIGARRHVAEMAIGRDSEKLGTTQWLNQIINRLPSDNSAVAGGLDAVRDQAMGSATQNPDVRQRVDGILDDCREIVRVEHAPNLRSCLGNQHDIINAEITQSVWRSLRPGS